MAEIQTIVRRIVERYPAQRVILLGSFARGAQRPDSDVDLLVVMPFEGTTFRKAFEIARDVGSASWIDVIVRRPEDVVERYRLGDPVMRDALDRGVVLYEQAA